MELDFRPVRFPCLVSPKMDGIRGVVLRQQGMMSNTLKPIPNRYIQLVTEQWGENAYDLDGELIVGSYDDPQAFAQSRGPIMTQSDVMIDFKFVVFDKMDINPFYSFRQRSEWAERDVERCQEQIPSLAKHIMYLEHEHMHNLEQLLEYEQDCIKRGFEGVMIRDPQGRYKFGRSTLKEGILIKLKRFKDTEGEIIGFEELMLNRNDPKIDALGLQRRSSHKDGKIPAGTLGAFVLRHPKFLNPFTCGSGLDESSRAEYWAIKDQLLGGHVKFKYQEHGSTPEAPRAPIFLEVRHPNDM